MRRPIEERVLELERRLYSIQHDVIGGRQAVPKFDSRPQVRLARIANEPEENDNTFEIIFLDGEFTQAAGQQSPAYLDRQIFAKAAAYNLAGNTLTQGTKVPVYWSNGHWWIYAPTGSEPPPPPAGESLVNVAVQPDFYYTTGPNAGDFSDNIGHFIAGGNYNQQDMNWNQLYGPDIGLAIVADEGGYNLEFNTPATYLITLTCEIRKHWYRFVTPPDPEQWFDLEIRFAESPSAENLPASELLGYHKWNTSTAYAISQDIVDLLGVLRTANAFEMFTWSTVRRIYQPTNYRTRVTLWTSSSAGTDEYGLDMTQLQLIVQQLFE